MEYQYIKNILEKLELWEVLDYYDGPKFYSCKDIVGQIYIVFWADSIDGNDFWLYSKVSSERYSALKNGMISIQFALTKPEEGISYLVKKGKEVFDLQILEPGNIDPTWLPADDDFLNLPKTELPEKKSSATDTAKANNRQVLDIAFVKKNNPYEIACGVFGRSLDALQNLINALACSVDSNVRRIPDEIKRQNELSFTGVFASSFGVRLQTKSNQLVEDDETKKVNKIFSSLIFCLNNPDNLILEIKSHNILARSRFKHLLNVLVDGGFALKTEWANPFGDNVIAKASYDDLKNALKKLEEDSSATTRINTYTCRLVGVDIEKDFFAVVTQDGELLRGKLVKQLEGKQFEVPSEIKAKIEEVCTINPLTDNEKWTYTLLDVIEIIEN